MRTLVLSIGNTSVLGGVFADARLISHFRVPVRTAATARGFARQIASRVRGKIDRAALGSVVPSLTGKLARQIRRTFGVAADLLTVEAPHGLSLGYRPPRQLGADRLAAALGARVLFPNQNVIVVDCGTATTVTALSKQGILLGGAILPGLGLWPEMLATRTAQLPRVALKRPAVALGRSTQQGLQSGFFHGHAGAIRELTQRIGAEAFGRASVVVIGTGGYAALLTRENLFTVYQPELILTGLHFFARFSADHHD